MRWQRGEFLTGNFGSAQQMLGEMDSSDRPDVAATVTLWFLTCPGQSPSWDHYYLSVIHLRPIDGVRPPIVRVPGATHEIMVAALDPRFSPTPFDQESWMPLFPLNVEEQLVLPSDASARELGRLATLAVLEGLLWAEPPVPGLVEPWRSVLQKSSAHLRGDHEHTGG